MIQYAHGNSLLRPVRKLDQTIRNLEHNIKAVITLFEWKLEKTIDHC